jgi:hypothetical protein
MSDAIDHQSKITWDQIAIDGILSIDRVVAEFQIESPEIPSRYFRVKITEKSTNRYMGRCNVSINNADNCPEWILGMGDSIDEALEDTLQQFVRSLQQHKGDRSFLEEEDFTWADCEDF